jgi:hypothetical protein
MNREIMGRQMFAQGGQVYPMQEGGAMHQMPDGSMMPDSAMPAPQGPAPQMPGMMAKGDQGGMDINAAAEGAMQNGIDPTILEGMLGNYANQMDDLDNAQDYETVMNGIRGDQVPVEGRYAELAEIVGPEDAQATPESVLTLIQPIMQMAAVDQGIGGLAQDEMNAPIEGAMAEGIMSTVNMGAPEGPAPVNFNQGGAVQYMQAGGPPLPGSLADIYGQRQSLYGEILGAEDEEAELADQTEMTKAQMLFDVAQGALNFASPGDRQMSPAERLAQSFSPVLGNISARAGDLEKFKQGQKKEKRALNLGALSSAEQQFDREQKEDAASRAATLASQRDSAERVLDRGQQLLLQGNTFKFSKDETETNNNFSMRLANRKIEAQNLLQQLQGAQSQDQINLRGRLTTELAQLNNSFAEAMQGNKFDFTTSERESTQDFQNNMLEKKQANDVALIAIQFDNSKESLQLRQELEQENMELGSELKINEIGVNFDNQLKRDKKLNGFELSRMERGHDFNVALADHNGSIASEARLQQQGFTAGQNVLDRAQREQLTLNDQTFRKMLQDDMQQYNLSEADTNRAVALVNRSFDEALALRGADQKDTSLNISERAQILDEAYKMGTLGVARLAAQATKLGSESKTNEIQYLTNADRLQAYASDTLGAGTAEFEQALLDYQKPTYSWDGTSFNKVAAPALARQITEAIQARQAAGLPIPSIPGFNATPQDNTGSVVTTPGSSDASEARFDSPEFKQSIFTPEGGVNYNSSEWDRVPTNIIDDDIKYFRSTGVGEVGQRISNYFQEAGREVFGFDPMDAEGTELVKADRDINTLRETILMEMTNWQDNRVLKTTQDALRKTLDDLTPGIWKTDEGALATLQAVKGNLGRAFSNYANLDPDYNPDARNQFKETQVLDARKRLVGIRSMMAEVNALEASYKGYLESLAPGGPINNNGVIDLNSTRSKLNQMMQRNNGG